MHEVGDKANEDRKEQAVVSSIYDLINFIDLFEVYLIFFYYLL
jgi:hypothetical protein